MKRTLDATIDEARTSVEAALSAEGFGVLTEIDVQATLKDKRGIEVAPYLILGACNPDLAHQALEADPDVGMLLPCNVVLRSLGPDRTEVAILDPSIIGAVSKNLRVADVALEARKRLARVSEAL